MSRREFSTKTKVLAFDRCGGLCEGCGAPLSAAGGIEYDHVLAAALGGDNTLENCQVLCGKVCHKQKTHTEDRPMISKSNRIRAKWRGAKKPSRPQSKFKRKVNGEVVPR